MFQAEYDFQPGDRVYVVLEADNSIQAGVVTQVNGNIFVDEEGVVTTEITYLILVDDDAAATLLTSDRIFATLDEAIDFVQDLITPTPEITQTYTPTPTVGITHAVTQTPTVTATPSPTAISRIRQRI